MRAEITYNNHPTIDILIAVAERGGVENCINMIGRYLTDKGCKIRIIQMVYEGTEWADDCMEFHYIFSSRTGHDLKEFVDGYTNFLHSNGFPDLTLATAWPMMSYIAKSAAQKLGANFPVASWLHASLKRYEESGFGGTEYIKYADLHFAISNEIFQEISVADPDSVIYRINNPVDLSKIHKVNMTVPGTLLFVGRLSKEKNIPAIFNAISIAKSDWKLRLVGDGEECDTLKKLANELNLSDKVEFSGWSDDPWIYADGSYALILSSIYEGSPLVALEALSCGLPVISNVSSKVMDIIKPGENGYLYPDNDINELAKILDFISDGKLPEISPEACRQSVCDYNPENALFDFYVKLYATLSGRIVENKIENGRFTPIAKDKISVIIPCYNAEHYISRCLDSILSQTIGISYLEIITVNDGSQDKTIDILKDYESRYPDNICVIDCDTNSGQSAARNVALNYVSGKYISFVDADDCISEKMFEDLLLAEKCIPSDIVSCDLLELSSEACPPISCEDDNYDSFYTLINTETDLRQTFADHAFITSPCGRLYKTDFIMNNSNLRFPEGFKMEDIYFTYMSVAYSQSWQHLNTQQYYYFKNPDSTMRSENLKEYYMDVHKVFSLAMDQYIRLGIFDSIKKEIGYIYFIKVFKDLIEYMSHTFEVLPSENIRIMTDYIHKFFPDIINNPYMKKDDLDFLEKHCK